MTYGASSANFEHICAYFNVNIVEFEQINASWARKAMVSDNKFVFSSCEKYIVQWTWKICLAICFHLYSPNIRLGENNFSREYFKKIS